MKIFWWSQEGLLLVKDGVRAVTQERKTPETVTGLLRNGYIEISIQTAGVLRAKLEETE